MGFVPYGGGTLKQDPGLHRRPAQGLGHAGQGDRAAAGVMQPAPRATAVWYVISAATAILWSAWYCTHSYMLQPLGEGGAPHRVVERQVERPGADDHLQQHGDVAGIGHAVGAQQRRSARSSAPAAAVHSPACSLSTARRARTSSPRLWSCVAVASMRVRLRRLAALHAGMEGGGRVAEAFDVEADIVAREQPAVAIEGSVLDRLGGDRRAQLLEARDARPRRLAHPAHAASRSPSGRSRGTVRLRAASAACVRRTAASARAVAVGRDRPENAPAARSARGAAPAG